MRTCSHDISRRSRVSAEQHESALLNAVPRRVALGSASSGMAEMAATGNRRLGSQRSLLMARSARDRTPRQVRSGARS